MRIEAVRPEDVWIKRIRKGDVLMSRSGLLRVVRQVSHHGASRSATNIHFAIKHCSWTGRCYTVYNGNDLVQMGYQPTRARRRRLNGKMDRAIESDFGAAMPQLTCCDVEAVA